LQLTWRHDQIGTQDVDPGEKRQNGPVEFRLVRIALCLRYAIQRSGTAGGGFISSSSNIVNVITEKIIKDYQRCLYFFFIFDQHSGQVVGAAIRDPPGAARTVGGLDARVEGYAPAHTGTVEEVPSLVVVATKITPSDGWCCDPSINDGLLNKGKVFYGTVLWKKEQQKRPLETRWYKTFVDAWQRTNSPDGL
jgi:hypothetical protein